MCYFIFHHPCLPVQVNLPVVGGELNYNPRPLYSPRPLRLHQLPTNPTILLILQLNAGSK
jgi:hypothetical protein